MSISRKNLSLLRRQLARRGELTKPSNGSHFQLLYCNLRTSAHFRTIVTSETVFYGRINTRGFSSDSSSSSISSSTSIKGDFPKDTIGWNAFGTRISDIIDNSLWLIPRKGTGKVSGCMKEMIILFIFHRIPRIDFCSIP